MTAEQLTEHLAERIELLAREEANAFALYNQVVGARREAEVILQGLKEEAAPVVEDTAGPFSLVGEE